MKFKFLASTIIALAMTAAVATADVTFSNVVIRGSLATGASYVTGPFDIDFIFPDAIVGDVVAPRRVGSIVITYEAQSDDLLVQDQLTLLALGALRGSGTIFFNEVVEDLVNPGVIASYNVVLDSNSQLPHEATLTFSRPSTHVKVKKTAILTAIDSIDSAIEDLASIALIEQRFVPEPAALVLLMAGLPLFRRR